MRLNVMDIGFSKEELKTIDAFVTYFVMEYPIVMDDPASPTVDDPSTITTTGMPPPSSSSFPPSSSPSSSFLPAIITEGVSKRLPPWSCDESLAMAVVRKLIDEGFLVTIHGYKEAWTVVLTYPHVADMAKHEIIEHQATSCRLALAICLASLHAVGIDRLPQNG